MSDKKIGMVVELDYCVGCYACQSACQDVNGLDVKETYLRCLVEKPESVEGEMYDFMAPVPYNLGKCAECIDRNGEAPCDLICIGKALHHGDAAALASLTDGRSGRLAVFV